MDKKQLMEAYGETLIKFKRYYKYSFSYDGVASDGAVIHVSYGGSSDDIYRFEVEADKEYKLNDFEYASYISVTKDGETVAEICDW